MQEPQSALAAALCRVLRRGPVTLLTGAGISTDSGIPDYRGPGTLRRARNPIQYRQFLRDPETRRRYWARSFLGWPRLDGARPNRAHAAVARLEALGCVAGLITQNVDRLHRKAGSLNAVELHGAMAEVVCLGCGELSSRHELQERLRELNPDHEARVLALAPDGDAELPETAVSSFEVASCELCHGPLKPHVVFFGESVPAPRVERSYELVARSRALLVAGSSLTVYSGYRFVRRARQLGVPVYLINRGETRADGDATLKLDAGLSEALPALAEEVAASMGESVCGATACSRG